MTSMTFKYSCPTFNTIQSGPKKAVPQFSFCDNFRKCTPILTIFSLLEQEIYGALKEYSDFHLTCIL